MLARDARVVTFANEAGHLINAAEQAEAKGFKFEGNVDAFAVGVVSQDPAALEPPSPLFFGRDDFTLPNVFAKN